MGALLLAARGVEPTPRALAGARIEADFYEAVTTFIRGYGAGAKAPKT